MFSSTMSIKHAFAYQKSRFSFRKNGYTSDKKSLSQNLTLLTNIPVDLKKNMEFAFVLK